MGKSRLAAELADHAAGAGACVLSGRTSVVSVGEPYRPLTEALLMLVRRGLGPFDQLGPYRAVLGRLVPDWQEAGQPRTVADSPVIVAEGVLRLLGVLGRTHGCLLVLEDLHGADAETLAVAEYLCDNIAAQPAMLLCTARPEQGGALDLADHTARQRNGHRMPVAGLGRPDTADMIAACLGVSPERVPASLTRLLWRESRGNPFIVEELLRDQIDGGTLVRRAGRWHVTGTPQSALPQTVARSILTRTDRIGPLAGDLFRAAALLGDPFPASLAAEAAGVAPGELDGYITAAITAQLVVPAPGTPGWYRFAHPLTAQALCSAPGTRATAALAARAADRIEAAYPVLPGDWCHRAARLRQQAGQDSAACALFLELGRRALRAGAAGSACSLLRRALDLATDAEPGTRMSAISERLAALGASGRFEQAFAEAEQFDPLVNRGLPDDQAAHLHVTLAQLARDAGRLEQGRAEIDRARHVLGPDATTEQLAPVNAIAAELMLDGPGADRIHTARDLARNAVKALDGTEGVALPRVACDAWQVLGVTWGDEDLDEAAACYARAVRIAEEHGLPYVRLTALTRAAGNRWLSTGDPRRLREALRESERIGAVVNACAIRAMLGIDAVFRGRFDDAGDLDRVWTEVSDLKIDGLRCYTAVVLAVRAAHRGRRAEMERSLRDFYRCGGVRSRERPLAHGLAEAFCALLDERRDAARAAVATAREIEASRPGTFRLSGGHGIGLLLDALDDDADAAELRRGMDTVSARLRWNRPFAHAALAVVHGRAGRGDEATQTLDEALADSEALPLAHHLICRLAAPEAYRHGWGHPVDWVRRAEAFFFAAHNAPVTGACRSLLRDMGAPARPHRTGTDRIPDELRNRGVTAREFDILELVAARWSNKEIADRLHLSPRTVEKHVASLLAKTGRARRTELHDYPAGRHGRAPGTS